MTNPKPSRASLACVERASRACDDGVRLVVTAKPKSAQEGVDEGSDGALVVRVSPAPEGGRANERVVEVIARALGVPRREVTLSRGEASRHKELVVRGLPLEEVRRRLARPDG